jgi:hypothetical protein
MMDKLREAAESVVKAWIDSDDCSSAVAELEKALAASESPDYERLIREYRDAFHKDTSDSGLWLPDAVKKRKALFDAIE